MSGTVGIVVATYGDRQWSDLAMRRALPSVHRQTRPADEVVHFHGPTLQAARNQAITALNSEWVICCDADDELDERYVEAMLDGEGDLRQPATLGIHPDGREDPFPVVIPRRPLLQGNFLVIGTMFRTELFHQVGGFGDEPIYEDWSLFIRMVIAGAQIRAVPEAIYRVHVSQGRNSQARDLQVAVYNRIRSRYLASAGSLA